MQSHQPNAHPVLVGFRTQDQHGSLYRLNAHGYTTRYNLSGHSSHGTVEAQCRCVFLDAIQADKTRHALHDTGKTVRLVYLDKAKRTLQTWQGDDATIPVDNYPGIGIFDKDSGQMVESWPTHATPDVGLRPFEMRYHRDTHGGLLSTRHMGHPIHKIYSDKAEFNLALVQAGFHPPAQKPTPLRL